MDPALERERRERQRLHVKRSYYRKLNKINAMRDEVRLLEHEYAQVAKLRAHALSDARHRHDGDMESYAEISALKEELRKENKQLQALVREHTKFQLKAQRFLLKDQQEQLEANDPSTLLDAAAPIDIDLMTLDACRELAQASQREIARFLQSNSYLTTGASVFGWRDRRKVEDGSLKFSVKKFFYGVTPLELSARGWQVTSTAPGLRQLYSPNMSVNMSIMRVQVVDDDNVIIYRVFHGAARGGGTVKSLFLVTRLTTETGFLILFRSIDYARVSAAALSAAAGDSDRDPPVQWMDMFTWIIFDRAGDNGEHCRFDFGGVVPSTDAAGSHLWMMEVLFIALRWETKVIGSTFALCAE